MESPSFACLKQVTHLEHGTRPCEENPCRFPHPTADEVKFHVERLKTIPCKKGKECRLPHCMFAHPHRLDIPKWTRNRTLEKVTFCDAVKTSPAFVIKKSGDEEISDMVAGMISGIVLDDPPSPSKGPPRCVLRAVAGRENQQGMVFGKELDFWSKFILVNVFMARPENPLMDWRGVGWEAANMLVLRVFVIMQGFPYPHLWVLMDKGSEPEKKSLELFRAWGIPYDIFYQGGCSCVHIRRA